jgi:tetratricopeptide (TPR) repeat protein
MSSKPVRADASGSNQVTREATLPSYRAKPLDIWLKPDEMDRVSKEAQRKLTTGLIISVTIFMLIIYGLIPALKFLPAASFLKELMLLWIIAGPVAICLVADLTDTKRSYARCQWLTNKGWWLGPLNVLLLPMVTAQLKAIREAELGNHIEAQTTLANYFWSRKFGKFLDPAIETTMANIYARGYNFDEAEKLIAARYNSTRSLWGSQFTKAVTTTNMGWIRALQGDYKESLTYSEHALEYVNGLLPGFNTKALKIEVLINIGRALTRLGRYEEAETRLDQAWELASKIDKRVRLNKGEVQLGLAELRMVQNRWDEALLYSQTATECYMNEVGPGLSNRDYAMRLNVIILRQLGREADAHALEMQADFDDAEMVEMNEAQMHSIRMHLLKG